MVAHVILVSAQGPNPSVFFLGACWDRGLDSDLDQGLKITSFKNLFYNFSLSGEGKGATGRSPSNHKSSRETYPQPGQEGGSTESCKEEEKTLGEIRYICRKVFIYFSGFGVVTNHPSTSITFNNEGVL